MNLEYVSECRIRVKNLLADIIAKRFMLIVFGAVDILKDSREEYSSITHVRENNTTVLFRL